MRAADDVESWHDIGHPFHTIVAHKFFPKVTSPHKENHNVSAANPWDNVALKVIETVREHDVVYRVTEEAFAIP